MEVVTASQGLLRVGASALHAIAVAMICGGVVCAQDPVDSARKAKLPCVGQAIPPGGSNPSDRSYSLCAIDRHPRRLSGPDLPAPTLGLYAGGDIYITVRPDGTVDSALTRPWTAIGDTSFENHLFEAVRRWRFAPPLRNRAPVRAAWGLAIASDARNDTLPQHIEWKYIEGYGSDTVVGRWVADTVRPPPLTSDQTDSIYAEVLRQLVRLQVLIPNRADHYCLLAPFGDSLPSYRLESIARAIFPRGPEMRVRPGCEREPEFLRLVLPKVYRTEHDRVVVFPRGDFLPAWPWGLDAKSWRAWSGRCVGRIFPNGRAAMGCGVQPSVSMAEWASNRPTTSSNEPIWKEGDSVRFTVFATRSGAFLVDTMHFVAPPIPFLEQHAIVDSLSPCGDWGLSTSQADSVFVVYGSVAGRALQVTWAGSGIPAYRPSPPSCSRRVAKDGPFAAFFLGGVGVRPTSPVRLCFADCAYEYAVDPQKHMLAAAPMAVIRASDLRAETKLGTFDELAIVMDHGPSDVTVLVAYRAGTRWPHDVSRAFNSAERRWQFAINFDGGRPDIEFLIYMFRRVAPTAGADVRK